MSAESLNEKLPYSRAKVVIAVTFAKDWPMQSLLRIKPSRV